MNRKGFISTAVVYAFFLLFLILCLSLLSTYNHYRKTLTVEKNDMKTSLKLKEQSSVLYKKILSDNDGVANIIARGTPDFSKFATTNEGMYSAPDDYGTSYYFRGAVDNNWVYFAGFYWRIIRINGDNSVRMIYSGTTVPTEDTKVVMTGINTYIGTSTFNNGYNDNMYVGYMYSSGQVHGMGTNSTIKDVIDTWYNNNLTSYTSKISDSVYCNDRSISSGTGIGTTVTNYGAYNRIRSHIPQLYCPTKSDAFTVNDTIHGNGALTYPIGLITADEVNFAGIIWSLSNSADYLCISENFWTETPCNYSNDSSVEYDVYNEYNNIVSKTITDHNTNYTFMVVRPVISLKSDVMATGSGTWDNPYIVEE